MTTYSDFVRPIFVTLTSDDAETLSPRPLDMGAVEALRDVEPDPARFSPFCVEPLLLQALQFLEKCSQYRREWDMLHERFLLFAVDRYREDRLRALFAPNGALAGSFLLQGPSPGGPGTEAWLRRIADRVATALQDYRGALDDAESVLRAVASDVDSPLNYVVRLKELRLLFLADLTAAYQRLLAVAQGVSQVYGITAVLPAVSETGYLGELILWARGIMHDLLRFVRFEQEHTIVLSAKNQLQADLSGDDATRLTRLRQQLKTSDSATLRVLARHFPGQSFVRLRGLSVSVDWATQQQTKFFRGTLRLPSFAEYRLELPRELPRTELFDQRSIPPLRLGRISRTLDDGRATGTAVLANLFNASPLGEFTLKLTGSSHAVERDDERLDMSGLYDDLNDLLLELRVASVSSPRATPDDFPPNVPVGPSEV